MGKMRGINLLSMIINDRVQIDTERKNNTNKKVNNKLTRDSKRKN